MDLDLITEILVKGGIVGVLVDPVVTFIRSLFNIDNYPKAKFIVALLTSLGGGVLVALSLNLPVDTFEHALLAAATVFAAATITYNLYWKGSNAEKVVAKVAN